MPVIHEHPFFADQMPLDEPPLPERESPFTPQLKHDADTSHFDMNALQKAQAERMRAALELDHDEPTAPPGGAAADGLGVLWWPAGGWVGMEWRCIAWSRPLPNLIAD